MSNILVVPDPTHPENEGKVFLFRYGKKIFEMLKDRMQPQFADETPLNPFDLWEGADFKIKVRKVDGYWNYDKSEFAGQQNHYQKMMDNWKQSGTVNIHCKMLLHQVSSNLMMNSNKNSIEF